MNVSRSAGFSGIAAVSSLLIAILILLHPQLAFQSLLQGFEIAFCRVVPAVFPMMIVSGMILESPLAHWLGLFFYPYTRLLGIRDRSVSTLLFLGLLGGFAVLSQGIDRLYRSRQIDRTQAELLLCAGLNAGPSFILLSVGFGMLGSVGSGLLLLTALYLGNLCAALLLRTFSFRRRVDHKGSSPTALNEGFPRSGSLEASMQKAVTSCITLCGYIAFFCLLCTLAQELLSPEAAGALCAILEATNGALFAANLATCPRMLFLLGILSWTGVSIQMQAKALLPEEITLRYFYLSRILAIPLSFVFFGIAVRLFPQAVPTMAGHIPRVSRFSGGIVISFLLMVAAFLYECTPKASLRSRQKGI